MTRKRVTFKTFAFLFGLGVLALFACARHAALGQYIPSTPPIVTPSAPARTTTTRPQHHHHHHYLVHVPPPKPPPPFPTTLSLEVTKYSDGGAVVTLSSFDPKLVYTLNRVPPFAQAQVKMTGSTYHDLTVQRGVRYTYQATVSDGTRFTTSTLVQFYRGDVPPGYLDITAVDVDTKQNIAATLTINGTVIGQTSTGNDSKPIPYPPGDYQVHVTKPSYWSPDGSTTDVVINVDLASGTTATQTVSLRNEGSASVPEGLDGLVVSKPPAICGV